MKTLVVEDDFTSRLVLQTFLSRYGECHVAVNGKEAVDAVREAVKNGLNYDLVCMDIMMPEMDGQQAVREIRREETAAGNPTDGVKIIMTTALGDIKNVSTAYQACCDGYLTKPINLKKLLAEMQTLKLV